MPLNPEFVFFTADLHISDPKMFGKNNVGGRPWKSEEHLFSGQLEGWNSVVPAGGVVFVLGDVFGKGPSSVPRVKSFLKSAKGTKHFIYGNHDESVKSPDILSCGFERIAPRRSIMVKDPDGNVDGKFQEIVLDHYPLRSWKNSSHGAWHLYGHIHSRKPTPFGLSVDVGVDAWGYRPVSYLSLKEFFKANVVPRSNHPVVD